MYYYHKTKLLCFVYRFFKISFENIKLIWRRRNWRSRSENFSAIFGTLIFSKRGGGVNVGHGSILVVFYEKQNILRTYSNLGPPPSVFAFRLDLLNIVWYAVEDIRID